MMSRFDGEKGKVNLKLSANTFGTITRLKAFTRRRRLCCWTKAFQTGSVLLVIKCVEDDDDDDDDDGDDNTE